MGSPLQAPPIEPMLAKLADALPVDGEYLYEPKWDGFRALVFRGSAADDLFIQSRDLKPLDRYFPELHAVLLAQLPAECVLDGEIVITTPRGLDFDALQMRLHPAASRTRPCWTMPRGRSSWPRRHRLHSSRSTSWASAGATP